MNLRWLPLIGTALLSLALFACQGSDESDGERGEVLQPGEAEKTIVVITPHNEDIRTEFALGFQEYYRKATGGGTVAVDWRNVSSNNMLKQLRAEYSKTDEPGYDVAFGGGEQNFILLAESGLLRPVKLDESALEQIPASYSGQPLYDPQHRWYGAAVSGFGFLYNKSLLQRRRAPEPRTWADLAGDRYYGMLCLADPTQSGSAAAAYEMIVLSAGSWPDGWARLLEVFSNSSSIVDSASRAADAPVKGEAIISTAIDFYGIMRVVRMPDTLVFLSPAGQTILSPDPVAALKNPPHPELAEMFVKYVLSLDGQALWALPAGSEGGPVEDSLFRTPIRRDVFEVYAGRLLPGLNNPYAGEEKMLDANLRRAISQPLRLLIKAAAIDNADLLRQVRRKLIEQPDAGKLARLHTLPETAATVEAMAEVGEILSDPARQDEQERITTGWQTYFRDLYQGLLE
jgi:ABC-type Fe3+ transport system substrate-binding protein